MKKKTLLNAIRILLLIIMGASFIVAAFMIDKVLGFMIIGFVSFVYLLILSKSNND